MTWRELVEAAEKAGVKPDDEVCVEFPDYGAYSHRTDEKYPSEVERIELGGDYAELMLR